MAHDVNNEVAAFVAVVPELSNSQLIILQKILLQEASKRLFTAGG